MLKKFGVGVVPGQKINLTDEVYLKQRRELVDLRVQQELAWCSLYECVYPAAEHNQQVRGLGFRFIGFSS